MFNKRRLHLLQLRVRFDVNLPPLDPAMLLLVGAAPLFLEDVPLLVEDVPLFVGDVPLLVGDVPLFVGDVPLLVGDVPLFVGDVPLLVGDVPLLVGDVPLLVENVPLLVEDVPFTRPPENKLELKCQKQFMIFIVSRHVKLKYPQCFYSNTVYLQDYCTYTVTYNNTYCIL